MLAEIRRVLRPGARLVIETDAPRPARAALARDNDWRLLGEGRLLLEQRTFDPADRRRADDADADRRRGRARVAHVDACASTRRPSCSTMVARAGFSEAKVLRRLRPVEPRSPHEIARS